VRFYYVKLICKYNIFSEQTPNIFRTIFQIFFEQMDYRLKISKLMEEKRLTKRELALKINKNENTIANYISGKTNVEVDVLLKIAEVFGVPVSYFFEDVGTAGIVQTANGNGNSQKVVTECNTLRKENEDLRKQLLDCKDEIITLLKKKS
jgi:transcriptional regulator with XRE-family HTH domain